MGAMSRLLETVDATPFLSRVKVPVLGLYPTQCPTITEEHERSMQELVPDIRLIHFPFRYHMVWMLDPASCAAYMLHFMALRDGLFCHD
jgi:hypothetical protein